MSGNPEQDRLADHDAGKLDWKRWGTYLSDRAWGTVREDYSADGNAWNYFPHDHARSRAYRWNEDGLGGCCDAKQHLCLAVALWNEQDPILKERMFGLSNQQGNHGEDVKEYYFFLDGTPTHSYMRMLYKYPQVPYPYDDLIAENGRRNQLQPEYELFDSLRNEFLANRYFDVFIEYAKASPEDILCRITAINRGPDAAPLHILPHMWYRNTWSWEPGTVRPVIQSVGPGAATTTHPAIESRYWYARASDGQPVELLFTENETNFELLDNTRNNPSPYVKDAFHAAVVSGKKNAVNRERGSKMAGHAQAVVQPGDKFSIEVRFAPDSRANPFDDFDDVFETRIAESDAFYAALRPATLTDDAQRVARQAFAGLLWSKQYYRYDVYRWLKGDPTEPPPPESRWKGRNSHWKELHNSDVILMPDTWEYPWYASWDLAYHCIAIAHIDSACAKEQLLRMGYEWYQHANGQFPAYEWDFDDVNPPVLCWAAWRVYLIERQLKGTGDTQFLKQMFQNGMLNFSYWVNRKDSGGRDVFGGGFLGMDNIGCFDRDKPLPNGALLEQSDGTSWMALYCATMLNMAVELAASEPYYQNMAIKYYEHFLYIAHAMTNMDGAGIDLWDSEDEFFYDLILLSSGKTIPLKIHSMVGLVPLFAVYVASPDRAQGLNNFKNWSQWFLENRPDLVKNVAPVEEPGQNGTHILAILSTDRLQAVLRRMLDPAEFLSDYGVRSVSRYHLEHPYVFEAVGQSLEVKYTPAESDSRLFGGNSNWRGPIWFPVNYTIIRSLHEFSRYYGDSVKVECPTGSGQQLNLEQVAAELARRLSSIFLRDPAHGDRRAAWGENEYFQTDPQWRDYIPFFEYFNGDTGAGVGASHQTGWTALVVSLIYEYWDKYERT
ncbi:MAG: glucosidase [Pirellulales bacterium]